MKTELFNFKDFSIIKESEVELEEYLDSIYEYFIINENLGAALGNPIKFQKIRNNAKAYQQALVQKALNNLDYEKKKQAAGGKVDKDKAEVLKAANAAKNQALTDKATAISDRMKDLATSPGLQKVKTLAISKAKVAAAETALKGADAEESKQLKIKIKELSVKAAEAEKAIKDYKKEDSPTKETPKEKDTEVKKETPKKETAAEAKERARKEGISKQIEKAMTAIQKAEGDLKIAQDEKANLSKELEAAKGTEKENSLATEVAGADTAIKDIQKGISDLRQNVKDLRNQLKEDKE
jgi:chromosome segregation ATPase